MDFSEFLIPVPFENRNIPNHTDFTVSNLIAWEITEPLDEESVVFITVAEYGAQDVLALEIDNTFSQLRQHFYGLSRSNWRKKYYDLGTILPGATFEDTCFALHQVVSQISQMGANIIVLGGTQALSYILYKSLKRDLLKVGTVDIKLDIDGNTESLNASNHITKMILDENHRLLEYVNIGSQAPYNAKEEFDVLEQLNFEDVRLGKVTDDLKVTEPLLRELDLLSVDMNVMQHSAFNNTLIKTPNGFNQREICGLMRYAGVSYSLKVLHISNFFSFDNSVDNLLVAEMLWYYLEAKENNKADGDLATYRVQLEEDEVVFVYAKNSERWWIELQIEEVVRRIPCTEKDYQQTLKGSLPEKWLRFYKKFY